MNLEAGQAKPLVELLNALKVYQTLQCGPSGLGEARDFPLVIQQGLMRMREDPSAYGEELEEHVSVITGQTVEQVKDVASAAPPEFQSAVFHCVSDFERCNTYYVSRGRTSMLAWAAG